MANNWAFIIWIGITGLLCNAFGGKRQELVNGKSEVRTTWFWAIAIFIPIALGAALRTTAEGDTGTYKLMFDECWVKYYPVEIDTSEITIKLEKN